MSVPATEPTWDQKIVILADAFARAGLPYAFGGAIALNYYREPRSTLDIDINVFISPAEREAVVRALAKVFPIDDQPRVSEELARDGQSRARWGNTFVDLFLTSTALHEEMSSRTEQMPFGDRLIPILSIEDLLICKVLFDRTKDWLDFEAVVATGKRPLDSSYILAWLGRFLAQDDPRLEKARGILSAAGLENGRPAS